MSSSMTKKVFKGLDEDFWSKWLGMSELEQGECMMQIVPIIQRFWKSLDTDAMKKHFSKEELLCFKASFYRLNSGIK